MRRRAFETGFVAVLMAGLVGCAKQGADQTPRPAQRPAPSPTAYLDAQEERLARIPGTSIERVRKDLLLVRLDTDVLFDSGSVALTRRANDTVQDVAEVLAQYPRTNVVVRGYTDSRGSATANQDLSQRRAEAVGGALVSRGVAPERMVATGYGEANPVANNETSRGRNQNRRVEIALSPRTRF
jgi:outer membrane protein OmpA-like peptidoglycan-associated protein